MKKNRKLGSAHYWLACSLCLLLVISSLVQPLTSSASERRLVVRSNSTQSPNAQAKKVTPVPPEPGVPAGLNLPNLDEVRQRQRQEPKAPPPIESTRRSRRKAEKPREKKKSHHASSLGALTKKLSAATDPVEPQSGPPSFTDDPLNPTGQPKTDVKGLHITELRYWINLLRNRRGLADYPWVKPQASQGAINSSVLISWEPIDEMRTALNQAIGPPTGGYAEGLGLNQPILATHIQELRDRVRLEWGSSLADQLVPVRIDLFNQSGNQIEARDCEWGTPLVSLPGRAGLDLGIGLSYSSLVWSTVGSSISFDDDRGDPSPGFKLGFPTIQGRYTDPVVGTNVYLLITSAGRRVELRRVGTSNVYEAGDSSYLQLIESGNSLLLRTTDGTQMSYARTGSDFHCTGIEDRNGNVITPTYNGDDLATVTDTLGRVIRFVYDGNTNLSCITQGWNGQPAPATCGDAHTLATFGWGTQTLHPAFSGYTVVGAFENETIPVLTQVGLMDGSHYNFEYTDRGQVNVIRHYAAAGGPGTGDDFQLSYLAYNYESPTDDCPRISAARVWASNWTGINGIPAEVVTSFADNHDGTHQMTTPDGTVYKEFYGSGWQHGLVTSSQVKTGSTVQKTTITTYDQDDTSVSYYTNPRVIETNVSDGTNNRRTTIDYSVAAYRQYGLPYYVSEYAANGTEMRRTYTDYNLGSEYVNLRIIGLVSAVHLVDVTNGWQPKAKTSYTYDSTAIDSQATWAVQHDAAYDQNYNSSLHKRGNVTLVSRWDINNIDTTSTTTTMSYDAAGSLLSTTDPSGHTSSVIYLDKFSTDGVNLDAARSFSTFAYPTMVTDADNNSSTIWYNYDFGAKTNTQNPLGATQRMTYDEAMRLKQVTTANTGAYVHYDYGPDYTSTFASVNSVAPNYWESDSYTNRFFDGLGRVFAVSSNHPGSNGGNKAQWTEYDVMGRAKRVSNPTEITGGWLPTGDDAAGRVYTAQTYDWKGRPLVTTHEADGTQTYASYDGCGCAGGEVVTLTDEVGRRQKIYSDVLGRQVKTEVLNTDGSVYSTTTTSLNARDQATLVRQWAGAEGSGAHQDTTMSYDGYGRLQTKHVPEQQVDVNNPASSDQTTWNYNADDTVQSVFDARGASVAYSYNARRLVTHVGYSAPAVNPPGSPISVPPSVDLGYDAAANRLWMNEDGQRRVTYHYNALSQMDWEERQFPDLATVFRLSYQYNLSGEVTKVTDEHAGTSFTTSYDNSGRPVTVSTVGYNGSTEQFASQVGYRAWGALKGMAYGNGTSLSIGYDARLQMANYSVNNVIVQWSVPPAPITIASAYQYHPDGQVKFVQDQAATNSIKDRAYQFDNVGRLSESYSGTEARNFVNNTTGGTADGPYRSSYRFDVWNNPVSSGGRYWSRNDVTTQTFNEFNRDPNFTYDAEANLISRNDAQVNSFSPYQAPRYTYDAAGRDVSVTQTRTCEIQPEQIMQVNVYTNTQTYDGDGQLIGNVQSRTVNGTTAAGWPMITHHLRSTVLGGKVISEYSGNGTWVTTFVYVGAERMGSLGYSTYPLGLFNTYRYADPVTGDEVTTMKNDQFSGFSGMSMIDANGVDVPLSDPFPPEGESGGDGCTIWDEGAFAESAKIIPGLEDTSRCILDGIPMDCSFVRGESAVECPNNDCRPVTLEKRDLRTGDLLGYVLSQPFNAWADGWQGFLPPGAIYGGNGVWNIPGMFDPDMMIDRSSGLERTVGGDLNVSGPQNVVDPRDRLPNSDQTACLVMADVAQDVANESSTIGEFDQGFSYFYHGPRIQGFGAAFSARDGQGGKINPVYRSNGSGFQQRYRDTGTDAEGGYYADQTHHYSFYLSVGINGQRAIYYAGQTGVRPWNPIPHPDNAGDQRLATAAYNYGRFLRKHPWAVRNIGNWIRKNICTKEGNGLYYRKNR